MPFQGTWINFRGGQSLVTCPIQGDLNMSLRPMDTLLPYLVLGSSTLSQGARVCYLVHSRGTWICTWNGWVLCYLILLRELNFASRGPELSLSGGHEYVPEADGYFVTLFCSGGARICLRGARVCYLISFRRTWVCPWNRWVLCYLVLLRRTWVYLRGARVYYLVPLRVSWVCLRGARVYCLISFRRTWVFPETVGCFVTWSCSGGPAFTSGGPGSITLSHSGWLEYVSGGPKFVTMVTRSGLSSGCGLGVSRESCSEGSGFTEILPCSGCSFSC